MSGACERPKLALAASLNGLVLAAGRAAAAAAAEPDIRDIRLPGGSDSNGWLFASLGAGLLALLGLGYVVWRRRRRPPLRSFERALQQLEAARSLLRADRSNEYCVAVSRIVRSYIEAGFRIPVTHRTTEEFVEALAERVDSPLLRHRARLEGFLRDCDTVKFGGAAASVPDLESLHRGVAELVRETRMEAHDAVPGT